MNNEVNNLEGVTGEVILKVGTSHINKSHQLGASQIESIDSSPIFLFIYLFIYLFIFLFSQMVESLKISTSQNEMSVFYFHNV